MLVVLLFCLRKQNVILEVGVYKAGVAGVEAGLASKFEPEAVSGVKVTAIALFQRTNDVHHGELHGPPIWKED
jgi:hypothetical protein